MFSQHAETHKFSCELPPLLAADTADVDLIHKVAVLAKKHGNSVYQEMLLLMVGKHFGAELSRVYWNGAIRHCREIFRPEFASRCFRPALLDYLYRVAKEITDPRIIEADFLYNIKRSSVTDGLTGLFNQTYFKNVLYKMMSLQRRSNDQSFALILLDLDHFKQYNDRCGHLYGDEALRLCAELISKTLRDGDIAVRYGGEEFALLLPNMERHAAFAVAERIRKGIEDYPFPKQELLESGNLTISGGIAFYPDDAETPDEIIEAADKEMYKSKGRRNTIFSYAADRRRSIRRPVRSLVEYAAFDGALYRPALSLDISEEGMGLGCESILLEGMTISIRMTRPYWPENLHITAKVRQVRRQDELIYVGLEFDEALTSMEVMFSQEKYSLATACR